MVFRKVAALVAGAAILFAACSSTGSTAAPASGAAAASGTGCKVGVSWNNYSQERWKKADEPAMQKAIAAAGGTYIRADANDKAEQQLTDIDSLINQGAKALIVLAKDSEAIKPAIAKATAAGIPVIAYDRLIEDPNTFYITFDNKKVGNLMAHEPHEGRAVGQLRRHPRRRDRPELGVPSLRYDRGGDPEAG